MERPRTVHEAGGFVNNAAKLVHTCGLSPLQDSHSNTDSCTMQILWERDPNLNLSHSKHVLHNTIWPQRLESESGSGNKSVWNMKLPLYSVKSSIHYNVVIWFAVWITIGIGIRIQQRKPVCLHKGPFTLNACVCVFLWSSPSNANVKYEHHHLLP